MHKLMLWGNVEVDATPRAGRQVIVDGWGSPIASVLQDCELPDFAPFRLPSMKYDRIAYAVRIDVTGRTLQRRPYNGTDWVKVQITFVGDGEPDTVGNGWMKV